MCRQKLKRLSLQGYYQKGGLELAAVWVDSSHSQLDVFFFPLMQQDVWPRKENRDRGSATWYRQSVGLSVCNFDDGKKDCGKVLKRAPDTLRLLPTWMKDSLTDAIWGSLTKSTCIIFFCLLWLVHHLLWIIFMYKTCHTDCHGYGSMVSSWHQPRSRRGLAGTRREGRQLPSERQWICAGSLCFVLVVSIDTQVGQSFSLIYHY